MTFMGLRIASRVPRRAVLVSSISGCYLSPVKGHACSLWAIEASGLLAQCRSRGQPDPQIENPWISRLNL